jgi:hypothetical protein
MNENEWELRLQEQFGQAYNPEDCMIFSVSMHFTEAVVSVSLLYGCCIFVIRLSVVTISVCPDKDTGHRLLQYKPQHSSEYLLL